MVRCYFLQEMLSFPYSQYQVTPNTEIDKMFDYLNDPGFSADYSITKIEIVDGKIFLHGNSSNGRSNLSFASMLYITDNRLFIHTKNLLFKKTFKGFSNYINKKIARSLERFYQS